MAYEHFMITLHGGKCCGMKHIRLFPPDPTNKCSALHLPEQYFTQHSAECNENYFRGEAPEETAAERLHRYVEYLRGKNSQGMVEVTMISTQLAYWRKIIEDEGFVEVAKSTNSNTYNTVHLFILVMDDKAKEKKWLERQQKIAELFKPQPKPKPTASLKAVAGAV